MFVSPLIVALAILFGPPPQVSDGPAALPSVVVVDRTHVPHRVVVYIGDEPVVVTTTRLGDNPIPGPTPDPLPPPAPTPDPTPPVVPVLWVTYIAPANATIADVQPVGNKDINAVVKRGSVEWREHAAWDAEVNRRKLDGYVKDAPITIFQDGNGKILSTLRGNDPADIIKNIRLYKGAK